MVKQNLFDGVLDSYSTIKFVDFSTKGRSQFIQQPEAFIAESENQPLPEQEPAFTETKPEIKAKPTSEQGVPDLLEEPEEVPAIEVATVTPQTEKMPSPAVEKAIEIEQVMNNWMQFLAEMFKMATGIDLGIENQTKEVNKENGEVVMRFKLPM